MKGLVDTYFDQLEIGQTEVTRGRTITEADIVNWCALTGDWFVLHSDKEVAARSVFGQRIAPGMMIVAFSGGLGVPADATTIVANYGTDRIRFPRPTFIGDTLHCEIEVAELAVRDAKTGIATFNWAMVNQKDELVMTCQLKVVLWRNKDAHQLSA